MMAFKCSTRIAARLLTHKTHKQYTAGPQIRISRPFTTTLRFNMPEGLKPEEVNSQTDPSVVKQYDRETPKEDQWKDLYEVVDKHKIVMLNTYRNGVGPVGRSMGVARRAGPDLLFLANKNSKKFEDISQNKEVQVTFQDDKSQDWVSVSGTATSTANDDPRIKELYSSFVSAWFGDLKDGVHDGTWKDPRMALIEVKSNYIVHWKKNVSSLGFFKEVGQAAFTGSVAQTGDHREFSKEEIEKERV
jgi:general stress protein 26